MNHKYIISRWWCTE